jgi:hypothetical protein
MTKMGRLNPDAALMEIGPAFSAPGQPDVGFAAFSQYCQARIGHRLLTLLAWVQADNEVQRIWSSNPVDYPVSTRKPMGVTAWGAHVLHERKPWIGRNADDMRWAFPDHALIARLGCAACISAVVQWNNELLGVVSLLDRENSYSEGDLADLNGIASLLVPGFLSLK